MENSKNDVPLDDEEGNTHLPCNVAKAIFNNPPAEPKSFQLFCQSDEGTIIAPLDLFEIFLTITTEGIFIKNIVNSETFRNSFTEQTILGLKPWINSLGFDVKVETMPKDETGKYKNYYCKVILRCDPSWATYFEIHKNIAKDYHYIFGGESPYIMGNSDCTMENLYAIFVIKSTVYKISFECI